ncbi:MAG: mechanosensitive ion channel, partial [Albidovulum sp.]|nr:mechanosensitive ion channel [Albidovulum sp.]
QSAASLIGAWVVIRLASGFIENEALASAVAWTAWALAALAALGLFGATMKLLDGVGMTFGEVRVSLLTLVEGVLYLGFLLWITLAVSHALERRIKKSRNLAPATQELIAKVLKIILVSLAFLLTIGSLGIDLTTLAVFGGALGIGVGIGLQKVVSNLVSGLLLLLDKSIKPNDVISVGATYGWVESLGARYASVRTRDGIEYLIPNEDLITQRVENWTHSDKAVRLNIPVGVSYASDVRLAMELCKRAARSVERVLADPEPNCLIRGFGENAADLEIRIWIDDPDQGRANVISRVLLGVWDLFKEHEIEIPFPQRDLHLKTSVAPWEAHVGSSERAGPIDFE